VLFFRELGFPLAEISRILADPEFDVGAALRVQRQLLTEKLAHFGALLAAVDAAIYRRERGHDMEKQDIAELFKDFRPEEYEAEAAERWGNTPQFRESKRRTAGYTERDFAAIKAESAALFGRLAELLAAGTPADGAGARAAAEAHRQHIERWFYPCPPAMHRRLGELYVNDPRFTANIDRIRPGLAAYACAAFAANAAAAANA
jgi:DNA-binding transcriptional MerR regulator